MKKITFFLFFILCLHLTPMSMAKTYPAFKEGLRGSVVPSCNLGATAAISIESIIEKADCMSFFPSEVIPPQATIYDCKPGDDGLCSPEKYTFKNPDGTQLNFVEYYYFLDEGECANNAEGKKILSNSLSKKQSTAQAFKKVDEYFAQPISGEGDVLIYRSHCFQHSRVWVHESDLESAEGTSNPNLETEKVCESCKKNSEVKKIAKLATDLSVFEKKKTQNLAKAVAGCTGSVDLNTVSVQFQRENGICRAKFSKGCGDPHVARLIKYEELSNSIMRVGGAQAEVACNAANLAFSNECGLSAGVRDSCENREKKFYDIKDKVEKHFATRKTKSPINEGVMMCLFNIETTVYDSSAINYTACKARSYNSKQNVGQRRKSSQAEDEFIFKGWLSSAIGLGQVTLETVFLTIRANPERYPWFKGLEKLNYASIEAKKLIEPLFIQMGEDEDLQIQIATDVLMQKYKDVRNSLSGAIKAYDGDDSRGTFVPFVTSCASCFGNKKWSKEKVYSCVLEKRRSILHHNDACMGASGGNK